MARKEKMDDSTNEIYNYTSNDVYYVINVHFCSVYFVYIYIYNLLRPRNSKNYQKLKIHVQSNRLFSHLCPGDLY